MKQIKMMLLIMASICFQNSSKAQTRVKNGDLYYNLSGTKATVTYNRSNDSYYHSQTYYYPSEYDKGEYVIPASIIYNGNEYEVTKVDNGAFAAFFAKYLNGGSSRDYYSDYGYDYYYGELSYEKTNIKNISLPNTITYVGEAAFYGQHGLLSIDLPTVSTLGSDVLSHCIKLNQVNMPVVEIIGNNAFSYCTELVSLSIPESVTTMGKNVFQGCSLLRELFYFPTTPPTNWTATTKTYVPDAQAYSSPAYRINDSQIVEMISFVDNSFVYTGQPPTTTWTNNVEGYTVSLTMPTLKKDVGVYKEIIPATFIKDDESFTANVVYRYTITPVSLTVKASNVSREFGEENPSFTCSYSGFVNGENEDVIITEPTVGTIATKTSDVGDYPISISGGSAKNYTFVYDPGTLTITKAPLTAKVDDATKQYGAGNPAFTVSYNGLKNGETVPQWTETLKIETSATMQSEVGTYVITATGSPINYNLSKIENGTLSITPAPLTIKANDATRKYFENEPSFSYSCTGFVNSDNVGVFTKEPLFTTDATLTSNAGKYKITPSGAEAKNYTISYEQGELTIMKRPLTTTSHCSRLYGDENPLLPIEYSGFVNNETENVIATKPIATTSANKISTVGNYPITLSGGEATNYYFVYEQGVLTITKASLSAKVEDATKFYGTQNPGFSIEYSGLKNGETIPAWTTAPTFQTEATKASGVGQYAIKAVNGVPVNYELEIADGTLSITPAPLAIKANNVTRKYFEDEPSFTYSCSGFLNDDNVDVLTKEPSFSTDAEKTSNAGKYKITPSGAEAKNYTISYGQGELTITKRQLKATSHCSRSYGEENPLLPIEYDGFVNSESEEALSIKPAGTTTAKKTSAVGDYPITVSGGEATNYDFVYEQGVLTVTKASLSAKVKDATKVYGAQNPSFSIEFYGLKNGETIPAWTTAPTFQTEATKASGVGQYAIKAVNGVPVNYELEITDGTLSITPAPLTIKANDATRLYYSDDPTFSYKCNGFVNGDDESVLISMPTLSTTATRKSNVGTYEIKVGETSCFNYSISYVKGTLTITPCTLIASVGNYERKYNEKNPVFEVKYEGFVGNEDESVLNSKAIANTAATITSDVGTYKITISGGSANNYTISYIPGILTINKAEQTIVWEQDLGDLKVGDQIELKATASSGLTVTYTSDNPSIAEVYSVGNKYYLDCKTEGELWLVAVQDGNPNYYSSPRIRKNTVIGDASIIKTNTRTIARIEKTTSGIRVIDANISDIIYVYTTGGQLIHSVKAADHIIDVPLAKGGVYIVRVGGKTVKIGF